MAQRQVINPQQGAVFSPAVRFDKLVYTTGMVGIDANGNIPPGIEDQSRLTMENLKSTLEAAGTSVDNVLKVLAFLADLNDRPAFNKVYMSYFNGDVPARSCVQVGYLGEGVLLEVEVVACIPD